MHRDAPGEASLGLPPCTLTSASCPADTPRALRSQAERRAAGAPDVPRLLAENAALRLALSRVQGVAPEEARRCRSRPPAPLQRTPCSAAWPRNRHAPSGQLQQGRVPAGGVRARGRGAGGAAGRRARGGRPGGPGGGRHRVAVAGREPAVLGAPGADNARGPACALGRPAAGPSVAPR